MKLAVCSWSLRSHINKDFPANKFGSFINDNYKIKAIELCSRHFEKIDSDYLELIRSDLAHSQTNLINIPVDSCDISTPDSRKMEFDFKILKLWVDIAAYLNCPAIRINSGGTENSDQELQRVIAAFKAITDYSTEKKITILLENHGGLSSDPRLMLEIYKKVASKYFAICLDFGNKFINADHYESIEMLAPYTKHVHAKMHDLDHRGNEIHYDFDRCVKIIKESGYQGYISAEFNGKGGQYTALQQNISMIKSSLISGRFS